MLSSAVTHDLRRGAAAEIAHLPEPLRGASDVGAARALGHQPSVRDRGITAQYIGHLREDVWSRRLEAPLDDHFEPALASKPFKRSRQSTETILAICDELGLDLNDKKDRIKAQETRKRRLKDVHGFRCQLCPLLTITRKIFLPSSDLNSH
jgi:hypothetical protein